MASTEHPQDANSISPDHDAVIEAAHSGHAVLHDLSKVDHTPDLSLRNIIRSTGPNTILNIFAVSCIYAAGVLALSVPLSQITFIVKDLGHEELESWISTASTAAVVAILPVMGSLTDIIGRRTALIVGCIFGFTGSMVAGFASSMKVLIIAQAFNGVGIALALLTNASVGEMVPAFTRPFWLAIVHCIPAAVAIVGPVYAGAFVKHSTDGWKWPFRIDAILFFISGLTIYFFHRTTSRIEALGTDIKATVKKFDYFGFIIFVGSMVCILMGLSWGGTDTYGWHSAHAIAPLTMGCILLLVILPVWEIFVTKNPLIDLSLFARRNFALVSAMAFVNGFVLFAVSAYMPLLINILFQSDPLLVGLYQVPGFATITICGLLASFILQWTGKFKLSYIFWSFALMLGAAILAVIRPGQSVGVPIGLFIIPALGLGGTTQLSFIIAQYCIPQEKLGLAMGIINTARSLGGSIGVAICGAILNSELNKHLIKNELSALLASGATLAQIPAIAEALETGVAADLIAAAGGNMAIVLAASDALKKTYGDAFRVVFLSSLPFGFIGLACSCFLKEITEYMSTDIVFGVKQNKVKELQINTIEKPGRKHIEIVV